MSENHLITERRKKIEAWNEKGFDGYAKKYDRTHTAAEAKMACKTAKLREANEILEKPAGAENSICGRIMQKREMGKLAFLKIRDVSGDFQVCFAKNVLGDDFKFFTKKLDLGDFIGVAGEFFVTKHGEPTLMAIEVTPLAKTIRPMPEKFHGITDTESCYRERNLDLMTNPETFDRFQKRSHVVREIRDFFHEKEFVEVETPILNAQAGGAMAKTFNTHHNALDSEFVLRIALELDQKRIVGGGLERVFEIGRCFRNEGIDPSHLQEFTSIEWYCAYDTLQNHEEWIEELFHRIAERVFGKKVFQILDKDEKFVDVDLAQKFGRVTFAELLKKHAKIDMFNISDEDLRKEAKKLGIEDVDNRGRGNLLDDIYKQTARPLLIQPTFVVDWPSDLKPLARPNGDGTSDVSQLLIAGWEITNGYGELIDPVVQRQLLEDQQKAKNAGDD
ncbi:MAG: OB-fold nucleic acid binding domain-containing protein, partial [Candidatus Peregrinibacteria bacterium]|nr:OB-fold nucleic acid binding domain-containing protein [Candidatus Peregrinibacteria bacterium]